MGLRFFVHRWVLYLCHVHVNIYCMILFVTYAAFGCMSIAVAAAPVVSRRLTTVLRYPVPSSAWSSLVLFRLVYSSQISTIPFSGLSGPVPLSPIPVRRRHGRSHPSTVEF